jgi:hypothetical protein
LNGSESVSHVIEKRCDYTMVGEFLSILGPDDSGLLHISEARLFGKFINRHEGFFWG